jgi:3-carboxy-cis,cis-muconate cycloisomerase
MTSSPFDHPLLAGLLGDEEIAPFFSASAELAEMVRFEAALAEAEAAEGLIPTEIARNVVAALKHVQFDLEAIRAATARDGTIGVEFVRQLRAALDPKLREHVHLGATSQDLVDTALVLRLTPVLAIFRGRLETLRGQILDLDRKFGSQKLMAGTRMQDAIPVSVADRLSAWLQPLDRHNERLDQLMPRLFRLQFGGAAGTLDKLGSKGPAVAGRIALALGLEAPPRSWHAQRDAIGELAGWLSLVTGALGKIGVDVALMAQNRIGAVKLADGGRSSAMPHKQNPVKAEVLVALARYNATLVGGVHQALVHEQERSGAAWTLEWLVLPQMVMTTATSLRTAMTLLASIVHIGEG